MDNNQHPSPDFRKALVLASPIGHSLTGALIYVITQRGQPVDPRRLGLFVLAANLPDLDFLPGLLIGQPGAFHNTYTHTLAFAVAVALVVGCVVAWRRWGRAWVAAGLTFVLVASHLVLDTLMVATRPDSGIPLWWPLTDEPVRAPFSILLNIERTDAFALDTIRHNIVAVGWEIILLGTLLFVAVRVFHRRRGEAR